MNKDQQLVGLKWLTACMHTVHNDNWKTLVILSVCLNTVITEKSDITELSTFVCHEYMNICLKGKFNKQSKKNRLHVHVFSFGFFFIYIVYTYIGNLIKIVQNHDISNHFLK